MNVEQKIHDDIVVTTIKIIKQQGFTRIRADLPNFEKPTAITWTNKSEQKWVPDITAIGEGELFIFEIKSTEDAFKFAGVKEQLEMFNTYSEQVNGRFMLVIPQKLEEYVTTIIVDWNLTNCQIYSMGGF